MSEPFSPNPYEGSDTPSYQPTEVVPDTSTPKWFGVLNVVFASILLLCGACYGLQVASQVMMAPMMGAQQQQMQSVMQAERDQEIADLQEQEEAAETEEDKEMIRDQIETLESTPIPKMPDMSKMSGVGDPRVMAYFVTDIVSGLILNILMLIAGIGLIGFASWGRRLSVWIAAIKIVRLAVICLVVVVVIAPIMAKNMGDAMEEMMAGAGPGAGPQPMAGQMSTFYGIYFSGMAVAMLVFGSIYPALSLWFLTRPSAIAACEEPTARP